MAEAKMPSQTVNETLIDSDKPVTHLACHNGSLKQKVTTCHVYDPEVSTSLLKGITLSPCQLNTEIDQVAEMTDALQSSSETPEAEFYTVSTKMMCSLCDCQFTSRQQQKDHYKLDWHRFNLKQRMMEASPVTEDNFEKISGDVSSISGSDSSTDNDSDEESDLSPYSNIGLSGSQSRQASNQSDKRQVPGYHVRGRRHPKVFFRSGDGQLVSIQRCILYGKKNTPATQQELVTMATQVPARMKWMILMIGGGHFAAAVFDGKEIVSHKTFHRYTVRAKRGTAQGMRDSQQGGNQPKSAGASLRRYNEAALVEDIHTLLTSWDDSIKSCHRIFMRAPSYNKKAFFGGKSPLLDNRDERIATIPFATRRPTYKELKRVHDLLSTVECYGDANEAEKRFMEKYSPKISQPKIGAKAPTSLDDKLETKKEHVLKSSKLGENKENVIDGEEDLELVLVEEEISTLDLLEFETSIKKPKRTKKKKKPARKQENGDAKQDNGTVEALCEACKMGHWERLKSLLRKLSPGADDDDVILEEAGDQPSEKTKSDSKEDMSSEQMSSETELQEKNASTARYNDDLSKMNEVVRNSDQDDLYQNDESRPREKSSEITCTESPSNDQSTGNNLQTTEKSAMDNEEGIVGNEEGIMGKDIVAVVNRPVDEMGATLLHVAVEAEQATMVWNLMGIGADPAIKNKNGHPPYVLCSNKEMRKEFRRFMAVNPEKFDYERSQIPSPLTSDREELRAAKVAEKKRLQKKNKRIREKEQKQEQKKEQEEQKKRDAEAEESRRFASLSDREKRALAAERRLNTQLASQVSINTTTHSNIQRCWLCGNSLASKVPFEYLDYKFCSIDCVKKHKQQKNSKS